VHPGRESVKFFGTLNLSTGEEIAMRAETMNAETSAQHLKQILKALPEVPILLLWDRAPWHSGLPVQEVLEANPRLEVMRFPVAAPDLNPQEHVWKAVRRAVSHNHVSPRLPDLAERFEQHLTSTTFESSLLDQYGFHSLCSMFK
jgi:transposase